MSLIFAFDPDFGRSHLLKSFCICVLGGLQSFVGVALGALILALTENFSVVLGVKTALQDFISFVLLVVVLVVMPGGLASLFNHEWRPSLKSLFKRR
jgi:branched-chain amino acid transport system permease protein